MNLLGIICKMLKNYEIMKSECIFSEITISNKAWLCFSIYSQPYNDNSEVLSEEVTNSYLLSPNMIYFRSHKKDEGTKVYRCNSEDQNDKFEQIINSIDSKTVNENVSLNKTFLRKNRTFWLKYQTRPCILEQN